jgi:hypothetical protein
MTTAVALFVVSSVVKLLRTAFRNSVGYIISHLLPPRFLVSSWRYPFCAYSCCCVLQAFVYPANFDPLLISVYSPLLDSPGCNLLLFHSHSMGSQF